MAQNVLVVGYRFDWNSISNSLENIARLYDLPYEVYAFGSRLKIRNHLDGNGAALIGSSFKVTEGIYEDPVNREPIEKTSYWPQYQSPDTGLFVCSTMLNGEIGDTEPMHDGHIFTKFLLPYNNRLVLHYRNGFKGDETLPNERTMQEDHHERLFHLPRNAINKSNLAISLNGMAELVKCLWQNDMQISLGNYMDIVRDVQEKLR